MKKYIPIYLYGAIIMMGGLILFFSAYIPFNLVKVSLGITLAAGAVFASMAAFSRQRKQVQFAYHEMHALAMAVYGVSVLLFCDSSEKLVFFTAFLLIFYTFSEIIFCNWLFNLEQKVVFKIVVVRVALGLAIGAGTVLAMNFSASTLKVFSILFMMVGVNLMLYVPIMQVLPAGDSAEQVSG